MSFLCVLRQAALATAILLSGAGLVRAELVAIVCPEALRPSFSSWIAHREATGRQFRFVNPADCNAELARLKLSRENEADERVAVILVGDGLRAGVAPQAMPARVVGRFGIEQDLLTDQLYADMAGADRVGRLPFNQPAALASYLQRVIERDTRPVTRYDTRLQVAAGVGGFSPLIDASIEGAAKSVVRRLASPTATIDLTRYDGKRQPLSISPKSARGGVWVWMGHGVRHYLPGIEPYRVAEATRGADVAVLLACYAGDFAARGKCVAEQLLHDPQGPLAVVASTRISMPYGNTRFGSELLVGHASPSPADTIGDLVSQSRRRCLAESKDPAISGLDHLARLLGSTNHSLLDERRDHAEMYQLLGDPLMATSRVTPMTIDTPPRLVGGEDLIVRGVASIDGRLTVQVVRSIDGTSAAKTTESPVRSGERFSVRVAADKSWQSGPRIVRVGIEGTQQFAIAASVITRSREAVEAFARKDRTSAAR